MDILEFQILNGLYYTSVLHVQSFQYDRATEEKNLKEKHFALK